MITNGQPSLTALTAAARAAHLIVDNEPVIFADPLAVSILGEDADAIDREAESDPSRRRLRMFIPPITFAKMFVIDSGGIRNGRSKFLSYRVIET